MVVIIIGSSITLLFLSCVVVHFILKRAQRQLCCLGLKIEETDEDGNRRSRYVSAVMKWRIAKVVELRKLMKPFKFTMKRLEFANQTDCCICQETLK